MKRTGQILFCSIGTNQDARLVSLALSDYCKRKEFIHFGSCTVERKEDGTLSYVIYGTVCPRKRSGYKRNAKVTGGERGTIVPEQ